MLYRVIVKDKETGEVLFDDTRDAASKEHAIKMMHYHIGLPKLERKEHFVVSVEEVSEQSTM